MDLSATILAAAGAAVPADAKLEGINLLPLLAQGATPLSRTLFWRVVNAGLNQRAVRDGDWKLLIDGTVRAMLFDRQQGPRRAQTMWRRRTPRSCGGCTSSCWRGKRTSTPKRKRVAQRAAAS